MIAVPFRIAGGLIGGLLAMAAAGSACADSHNSPRITSYSTDHCAQLVQRLDAMIQVAEVPPPREVVDLSREGQRMCDGGQLRAGVMRLRRALMLLQKISDGG